MAAEATEIDRADAGPLVDDLRECAERINLAERYDIPKRLELYNALRERGFSLKEIADIASEGRERPLTDRAVSFTINKDRRQREGTWPTTTKPAKKSRARKRSGGRK
jgi:hypothetical protein